MKRMTPIVIMSALVLLIAGLGCKGSQNAAADSSLNRDLALAAHQRDSLDSVSALESQRIAPSANAIPVDPHTLERHSLVERGGRSPKRKQRGHVVGRHGEAHTA